MIRALHYVSAVLIASLFSPMSVNASNESECEAWCSRLHDCDFCSDQSSCGVGYSRIASFRVNRPGKNWHGCAVSASGVFDDTPNRTMCLRYCRITEDSAGNCVCTDENYGCGRNYWHIATFKGIRGENWYACKAIALDAKRECEQWCRDDGRCVRCSALSTCGTGEKSIADFGPGGYKWHACERTNRGEGTVSNQADCEQWCRDNSSVCDKCSKKVRCGSGYKRIRKFNDHYPGHNWYACERR